ncbi:MAG: sugar transferase [Candidatus Promineifilaceae bacterium]
MRRFFDFGVALVGLILLSPAFFVIAVLVKVDSTGPVFYKANRVGENGRLFKLYKFRSMAVDAEKQGPGITVSGDERVTRVGRFLRRTKLDELPQLVNVLKGEMSLVGPRPEDPRYVNFYTEEQRHILQFRPGITSAASLQFRREEEMLAGENWQDVYLNSIMPEKINIDLAYLRQRTLFSDIKLILSTITAVIHK